MVLFEALLFLALIIGAVVITRQVVQGVNQRKLERLKQNGEALKLAASALRCNDLATVKQIRISTENKLPIELEEALKVHEAELQISYYDR